jgi:hypothetical protein
VAPEDQPNSAPEGPLAEGVPLVYVNWIRTVGTPGDIALDVGYQPGNAPPQPAARLAMTWETAKLLYEALGGAIQGFEREGEPIRDLKKHLVPGPNDPRSRQSKDQEGESGP